MSSLPLSDLLELSSEAATPELPDELPEGYYLDHFCTFLDGIRAAYLPLLAEPEAELVHRFAALSSSEQRLFVRLANRRGTIFFRSTLRYAEIADLGTVLTSLAAQGFVRPPHPAELTAVLGALRKSQLVRLLKETEPPRPPASPMRAPSRASLTKPALIELVMASVDFDRFSRSSIFADVIVQEHAETLAYLCFLAFGDVRSDLSLYTLRDLGIRRSNGHSERFTSRFASAEAARSEYAYRRLRDDARRGGAEAFAAVSGGPTSWPPAVGPGASRQREKLLWELSAELIKSGDRGSALAMLEHAVSARATERRLRLLYDAGERENVRDELRSILDRPSSTELLFFAEDFWARKFGNRKKSAVTRALEQSAVIRVDGSFRRSPERGAIAHFAEQGAEAFHTENSLWRALFGLLFWEQLFGAGNASIHSEFDRLPQDLRDGTFASRHAAQIDRVLDTLAASSGVEQLHQSIVAHRGTPNGVFAWSPVVEHLVPRFAAACAERRIDFGPVMRELAHDFESARSGFPDLLVFDGDGPRFVEVKSLGDKLQAAQLRRIVTLASLGFRTDILRVEWDYDSDQVFVVVDVETTGGAADRDRITEIGAVKVQRGAVLGRFSTLVNPGRRIPWQISQLTGITDAMVANAPPFADIADAFLSFVGNAIVVGHNVAFDYAFLREELRRLGHRFQPPTVCTRAGMRRSYPDLPSYALAELCREFEIPLTTHHRALCDAEATAELLKFIFMNTAAT